MNKKWQQEKEQLEKQQKEELREEKPEEDNSSGIYNLVIRLDSGISLNVGRLGLIELPPGFYIYTGSAMNSLKNRVLRHLKKQKNYTGILTIY